MQLNESTYETIFLLYIDNELSPKERLEVEAFIAGNPNYALEMEALKATVLIAENIPFAFKENLKQQEAETSLDELEGDLEEDWDATYATILKADVDAIPRLSTSFKNALKKEVATEGIILKPFGFNKNKFTYATIAALLMVFLGYQQLTKSSVFNLTATNLISANTKTEQLSNKNTNSNASNVETGLINKASKIFAKTNALVPKINQEQKLSKEAVDTKKVQSINIIQKESIAMAEPTPNNRSLNQTVITKLPSNYNNPININAAVIATAIIDSETATEVNEPISYEVIDTEDPDRTIFIANFEIDGNKLRGLKRKVTSLFKNNKSDRK
jgi:hypothetical protein